MTQARQGHIPGEIGIWLFVAGDLLIFTVFFVVIALGRAEQPALFAQGRGSLDLWAGGLNTLFLLTGSWFVAVGVEACRSVDRVAGSRHFLLAILCGAAFVANKCFEWNDKISTGITPATNDFYMLFYIFTGIHLLHVLVGIAVLFLLHRVNRRPVLARSDLRSLESGATFWHLIDLLWIVLFALFYLM